jgi:CRISPR/Cas system-associated endonuclease Cas3-HD
MASGNNAISSKVVREMQQLFSDFGYHELESAHFVINRYWEPFTKEMLHSEVRSLFFMKATNGTRRSRLVDCYIT